jgi:hypothetical protein
MKTIDIITIISAICFALYSIFLPILLMLTTWSRLAIFENTWLDYGFIISGIYFAYFSIGKSLKKHRNQNPTRIAIIGVILLVLSRLEAFHDVEVVVTVFGAIFLVVAHSNTIMVTSKFRKESIGNG